MVLRSVRLPDDLAREIDELRGDGQFTALVCEALRSWVKAARRAREDTIIAQALAETPAKQQKEEDELLQSAEKSSLEILEEFYARSEAG